MRASQEAGIVRRKFPPPKPIRSAMLTYLSIVDRITLATITVGITGSLCDCHCKLPRLPGFARMHTLDLLDRAIDTAKDLGYRVRREWLEGQGGGYCEIAGQRWIFLDLGLSSMEQLGQVLEALRHDPALDQTTVSPELGQLLGRRAA